VEAGFWQCGEIGLAGDEAPHAADGVFDAALLPGCMGIAEEGRHAEGVEAVVAGELGAIVEGERSPNTAELMN